MMIFLVLMNNTKIRVGNTKISNFKIRFPVPSFNVIDQEIIVYNDYIFVSHLLLVRKGG